MQLERTERMKLPLQITYRDIESSPAISEHITRHADKLDQFCDRIMSCRVAIEAPNRHTHHGGKRYHVRIDLKAPGVELVASHTPPDIMQSDLYLVIDEAFADMKRQLEDYVRMSRWEVKRHNGTPHARVAKIFRERGYGFLEAADGREIYFHQNSVLRNRWDQLEVGTEVRFAEEDGDKGPQASTVDVVGRPRKAPTLATDDVERPSYI
jgi:ribosomal subunit interface protein